MRASCGGLLAGLLDKYIRACNICPKDFGRDGPEDIYRCKLRDFNMYADDIVVLAETEEDLHAALRCVELWAERWQLQFAGE